MTESQSAPHFRHFLPSSSLLKSCTAALICVLRSVQAVEALLTNNLPALLAIPPHPIHAPLRPRLLQHHAYSIFKSDGIMRRIGGQEKHAVLVDGDVSLTGRSIHISQIRPSSPTNPGLAPHEISFLRLLEAVTNGSQIEISYTGTTMVYKPGLITGSAPGSGVSGGVIRHELPAGCTRGVSYFLIPLCLLAPFSKASFNIIFAGPGVITSATPTGDMSVDSVRTAILPLYAKFGISKNIELRILRRSNPGHNGRGEAGEVQLVFGHQVRLPKTIHLLNPGRVKKI